MRANRADAMAIELERAGVPFERDASLARLTTIGLGGPGDILARPRSSDEVHRVLELAASNELPLKVLGSGSNLLVSDEGVAGVVLHTAGLDLLRIDASGMVEAGAGCNFPALVRKSATVGLRGLEAGVGIPGSLGGVLTMNAGAYQFSIGPLVDEVVAVSLATGKVTLPRTSIDFRYRSSSFGDGLIVSQARLCLTPDDPALIRVDIDRHLRTRKQTQPVGVKSAGCIFKNPEDGSAGRILDELGLKGLRIGGARVSEVHANFIVHDGSATTAEVVELIETVRERVRGAAAIELESEVTTWN